jgi:RHS repeat-associated protein
MLERSGNRDFLGLIADIGSTYTNFANNKVAQPYLFNNKEYMPDLAIDIYDFGARPYDPSGNHFWTQDPMAELYYQMSPYAHCANNPIIYIDPDGMKWADPIKDQQVADMIQKGISNKLAIENSNLKSANKRVERLESKIAEKGSSKGLENRLSNAKSNVASINTTISDLNSSSQELKTMGSTDVAQEFTFNEIEGSIGLTSKKDGVITMDIVSDANAIHEADHGYKMYKGTLTEKYEEEVSAYNRQYSYDAASVPGIKSSNGTIAKRSTITRTWVAEMKDANGNYIYMPQLNRYK